MHAQHSPNGALAAGASNNVGVGGLKPHPRCCEGVSSRANYEWDQPNVRRESGIGIRNWGNTVILGLISPPSILVKLYHYRIVVLFVLGGLAA